MRSDDTGAWFERRLREPSFVIPEIADFRRQRGTAREREGAFGNAVITAEVRYFPVIKHYRRRTAQGSQTPVSGSSSDGKNGSNSSWRTDPSCVPSRVTRWLCISPVSVAAFTRPPARRRS